MSHAGHRHEGHDHGAHSHAGHDHAHGVGGREVHGASEGSRVLIAALLTGGFMFAEVAGGLWSGSLALLADAGHMLTDAVALTLAYLAFRMGTRPGNSRLTYGFHRLKILVAYTNGLLVLAIAVWIGVEAAMRLAAPAPVLGARCWRSRSADSSSTSWCSACSTPATAPRSISAARFCMC